MSESTASTERNEAILGQDMPKAKRYLVTEATSEVIIFHSGHELAPDGTCPLCGADVPSPPKSDEKELPVLPLTSEEAGDESKNQKEEKQK
jgi:hypothetical protein